MIDWFKVRTPTEMWGFFYYLKTKSHGSGWNLFGNKVEKKFGIKEKLLYLCITKTFYYVQEKNSRPTRGNNQKN